MEIFKTVLLGKSNILPRMNKHYFHHIKNHHKKIDVVQKIQIHNMQLALGNRLEQGHFLIHF
jgi:hypothetical protein